TGEQGIRELVEKSTELLKDVRYLEEKELVQKFLRELGTNTGMVTYGQKQVLEALELGAVETLLISEEVDVYQVTVNCQQCDYSRVDRVKAKDMADYEERVQKENCPECGSSKLTLEESADFVEELAEKAKDTGASIEIISTDTEEGMILFKSFGGIVALLRYPLTNY
ncbi:MAG: peptide chain release factor 1, partial [Promethearchaeota archaeon]